MAIAAWVGSGDGVIDTCEDAVMDVLASRKVRLSRQVDGQNRLVKPEEPNEPSPAAWLKEALK